jgi:DUF438 domain-containing protein
MNKLIRIIIQMLANKLMEEKTWKLFKKTVKMLSNEEITGEEKKQLATEMIKTEVDRLPNSLINLGIELAVKYISLSK